MVVGDKKCTGCRILVGKRGKLLKSEHLEDEEGEGR
jgi:hypothetical protein